MTLFQLISFILLLVAIFGYVNHRFIHLPNVIGIAVIGMVASMITVIGSRYAPDLTEHAKSFVSQIDFASMLLHGILGLLLFAGGLHTSLDNIAKEKWTIIPLATIGVVTSTFVFSMGFYLLLQWFDIALPYVYCLLFGALISPTDPIAVLAVMSKVGVPKSLETRITGESLFNDGTGVVVFLTVLSMIEPGKASSATHVLVLFLSEVFGGLGTGAILGFLGVWMLRGVNSYAVEILMTLAMATAGYAFAELIHVSAPITVVLMGLMVGNHGKNSAMSEETRHRLFDFWEVVDELLNLLLFGLIGLEMIVLPFSPELIAIGIGAIVISLISRLTSIAGPVLLTPRLKQHAVVTLSLMTWGGLKGGISIALALSLPDIPGRDVIITSTYAIVVFSILVQSLTLQGLCKRLLSKI